MGGGRSWRYEPGSRHGAAEGSQLQQRAPAGATQGAHSADSGSRVSKLASEQGVYARYVDNFTDITYDPNYRPQPRRLSTWLQANYEDGTRVDINLDDIEPEPVTGKDTRELLAQSHRGAGERIFPKRMDSATTPRLWAARKSAVEAMEVYNYEFMVSAMPAVFFVIFVAAQPPLIEQSPIRVPAVTRRTVIQETEEGAPVAARNANAARLVGDTRVQRVVEHFGEEVVETGRQIKVKDVGSSDVDVVLTGKRFCEVGGPSKGFNLSNWGKQLKTLKSYADQEGGSAYFFYDKNTPLQVIELAVKWLGRNNVRPIP